MKDESKNIIHFIETYTKYLRTLFNNTWNNVIVDANNLESYSVVGGLLSRQVTLAIELSNSPNIWNGHSAPLFLRPMIDLYISLAWILEDIHIRSKQYILYGLSEEKLSLELFKKELIENPDNPDAEDIKNLIEHKSAWINSQKREFLVEINLGHWAQLDNRKMAQEADCEKLYKFAFKPFSQAVHNMWPHVSKYNCRICTNPLHRNHLIPSLNESPLEIHYVFLSCKYLDRTFKLLQKKLPVVIDDNLPLNWWDNFFVDDNVDTKNA